MADFDSSSHAKRRNLDWHAYGKYQLPPPPPQGDQVDTAQGGTCQNFDRDARPIFLGLKFGQILFFWVGKFFSYFSGFRKISAIFLGLTNFQLFFLGLPIFVSHT